MEQENNIILIAKMYTGEYIEENIGHEIINFFKPNGKNEYYGYIVYNGKINSKKCKNIKSILFVSDIKNRKMKIIAKIDNPEFISNMENNHDKQVNYIIENDIRYGGVLLNKIMKGNREDETGIYITYKTNKIMKPREEMYISLKNSKDKINKNNIKINCNIGHNIKYISSKEDKNDYNEIDKILKSNIWEEIEEKKIDKKIKNSYNNLYDTEETFLDIINKYYDESIFSNMLCYYFKKKEIFKAFAQEVLGIKQKISNIVIVEREKKNIDLFIEDEKNKICIVIENKIKSGINGRNIKNKRNSNKLKDSQLVKYKEWVENNYKDYYKRYYIFVPNYKENELKKEIEENNLMPKDCNGNNLYEIITYKQIFDFFNKQDIKSKISGNIYYKDFLKALSKHIYTAEKEMERKFVCAIKKAENEISIEMH